MKKILFLLFVFCLSAKAQDKWNKGHIEFIQKRIAEYGFDGEKLQKKLLLPDSTGSVYSISDQVIGIEKDGLSFWFFVNEDTKFKGNLIEGKFLFRFSEDEKSFFIQQAKEFFINTPRLATAIEKSSDPLTQQLMATLDYLKDKAILVDGYYSISNDEYMAKLSLAERGTFYLSLYDIQNEKLYLLMIYQRGPLYNGLYQGPDMITEQKITEENVNFFISKLQKILDLKKG